MVATIMLVSLEAACFLQGLKTVMSVPAKATWHIYKSHKAKKFAKWEEQRDEFLDDFATLLVHRKLTNAGYQYTMSNRINNDGTEYRFYLLNKEGSVVMIEVEFDDNLDHGNISLRYKTDDKFVEKFLDSCLR